MLQFLPKTYKKFVIISALASKMGLGRVHFLLRSISNQKDFLTFTVLLFSVAFTSTCYVYMYNNNRLMGPPGSHPPSTGVNAGPALPQPPIVSSNSSSNGTQVFSTSELGQHSNFPCQTHFPVNANSGSASSASPKQVDTKKGSSKPSFSLFFLTQIRTQY